MAFERVNVDRPEAPERSEPGIDLPERLGPDPIDAPLGFDARLHEAGLAQHAEVLGHRRLRHPQPALDLADGASRLRMARRFGSAMIANDDSTSGMYTPKIICLSSHIMENILALRR